MGDGHEDLGWLCVRSWRFGAPEDRPVGGFGSLGELCRGYEEGGGGAVCRARLRFWMVMGSVQVH